MLSVNTTWTMEEERATAEIEADSYARHLTELLKIEQALNGGHYNKVKDLIEGKDYSSKKTLAINNPLYLAVILNQVEVTQDLYKAGLPADDRVLEIADDVRNNAAFALQEAIKIKGN